MPRIEPTRSEIQGLIRAVPFRRFLLNLENGERILIENPENIAFDPEPNGTDEFCVISGRLRLFSTFAAVAAVALADHGGAAA